ncbi:MAG: CvpA family protein [Defluviitaleaceae bacterium]|nr:CvpA family protein [Defluviitaleaceae bacterium]
MILDVIVIFIIALNIIRGYIKGFVEIALRLVFLVVAISLSRYLHYHLSVFLTTTPIYDNILSWTYSHISLGEMSTNVSDNLHTQIVNNLPFPYIFTSFIDFENMFNLSNFVDIQMVEFQIASAVTIFIINVISGVLLVILFTVGFGFLAKSIGLIAKLPVLKSVNKILGVFVGAISGVFGVWIFLIIYNIVFFHNSENMLEDSVVALWFNQRNFILSFVMGFFH